MCVSLSLVVPAYNEAVRLPPYLHEIRTHFSQQFGEAYEVMVIDDGSSDGLADVLQAEARDWPQLTTARHPRNRGKGAAVRTGMLAAAGELLLFADADGATPIEEERRLRQAIEAGADVATGSRLVDAPDVRLERSWSRSLVGRAFAGVARCLLRPPVLDTQCGFKMFRRDQGRKLFGLVREEGYLFDLEVLILADRLGYRVVEVPVNWSDRPGSRLSLWRDAWPIASGLWRLRRRCYNLSLGPAHD
jgi:dolichyl-phosphate beta-glucosyltransferase